MKLRKCQPILIFGAFVTSFGQTGAPVGQTPCLGAGQLSDWDTFAHKLIFKSDAGNYSDLAYDDSTVFTNGSVALSPQDLDIGDRLCVQAFRDGGESITARVLVVRRSQIDAQDKDDLMQWERESEFGTVNSVDARNGTISLQRPDGSGVLVSVASPIAFWALPARALDTTSAVAGDWKSLAVGDAIYVRGDRARGTKDITARLIVSGGFSSFAGSIESMDPLTEQLRVRDFSSGQSLLVHFYFMRIYFVGNASQSADRRLYWATVGDLKEGDSVLVLARQDQQTGKIDAWLLVTGFSGDGIVQTLHGQTSDWIFSAIGFGGQPGMRP